MAAPWLLGEYPAPVGSDTAVTLAARRA